MRSVPKRSTPAPPVARSSAAHPVSGSIGDSDNAAEQDAHVGFVDGHLQLMRLHPMAGSWNNFVRFQFVKPLQMLLDAGCSRVVDAA